MFVIKELKEAIDDKEYLIVGVILTFAGLTFWILIPLWFVGWAVSHLTGEIQKFLDKKSGSG